MKVPIPTTVVVIGTLWGAIPLSYWLTSTPIPSYVLILLFYVSLFAAGGLKRMPHSSVVVLTVVGALFTLSALVEMSGHISVSPYVALALFAINLSMLLAVISPDQTFSFLRAFFRTTAVFALAHIALVFAGRIGDNYGRYLFFGDTHPNLGGEIYGIAAFAGAVSVPRKTLLILSAPLLFSAYMMQTRTGMAVVALTLLIRIFVAGDGKVNGRSLLIGMSGAATLVIVIMFVPFLHDWFLAKVVLAEDSHRGLSTGLVSGRDGQWGAAFQYFLDSPVYGQGVSFFDDGKRGAHNPVLYSLVYFGVAGLVFWVMLLAFAARLMHRNTALLLLLSPNLLMILLNDRFLNSNAFPLLLYFSLIQLSRDGIPSLANIRTDKIV